MAKLSGITQVSEATLSALNTQLLTELKVINDSKMAESEKERLRDIAFGKYNAAITAAGDLAAKESYSERVQIQLTEIAKLASLSKTTNASLTLTKLRESEELSMIDRVAAAQKRADDARLKALQEYVALLGKVGTGAGAGTGAGGGGGGGGGSGSGSSVATLSQIDTLTELRKTTQVGTGVNFLLKEQIDELKYGLIPSVLNQSDERTRLQQMGLFNNTGGISPSFDPGRFRMAENASYTLNFTAGVIAQPDEFATLVQDTIQRLNRGGDPISTAGAL
jgi:hypothetical protein